MANILNSKINKVGSTELVQTPASNSPQQSSRHIPKWLAILLFVIIILLLFGGVIANFQSKQNLAQNTHPALQPSVNNLKPSATVDNVALDWQTYRNEEYGFEFKYPKEWIYEITSTNTDYFSLGLSPKTIRETDDSAPYSIIIVINKSDSIDDQLNTFACPNKNCSILAIDTTLDGTSAKQASYQTSTELSIDRVAVIKDKYVYDFQHHQYIKGSLVINQNTDETKVFDQILSTFRFIEKVEKAQQPAPPPTDLNTCVVGGCSGQLCLDDNIEKLSTTCEWLEEYQCYRVAECKRQVDGKCGWTKTEELMSCLENNR